MKRRDFLHLMRTPAPGRSVLNPVFSPVETLGTGLEAYTGPWEIAQVIHLLRRVMFGAKWEDIQFFLQSDPDTAVETLLTAGEAPPLPVNDYNSENFTDPAVPSGDTWVNAFYDLSAEPYRIASLKSWWVGNLIDQESNIIEKLILFWHNHIPVQFGEVFYAAWNFRYVDTLRQNALGNFRDLIKAMTLDPAMLHFLNGQFNSAGAPDENYARELQELFCIGKGPDSHYTEEDVREAARILTGWRVNYLTNEIFFQPLEHDSGDKQFSSFYDNLLIQGKTGSQGAEELDELLDMILANDECALFLCRKIYRFFVYHEIDELTEEMVIGPLAQVMRDNNYELRPVLAVLFKSQHFFDMLQYGAQIKGPMDHLIGMYREFHTPIPDRTMLIDRYQHNATVHYVGALFLQNLGDPPNVSGWPAYHQAPVFDKSWISTDTLPRRAQFSDWLLWAGISTENFLSQLDILGTVAQLPNPADPNALVDDILKWMYSIDLPLQFRLQLKAILLSGQISDYYWTDAWVAYVNDPTNEMKRETVRNRLLPFFYTILHQEEYQLS